MKKLVLDYKIWRSGGSGSHKVGRGNTLLLNNEGYQCCLGQFAKQFGCTNSEIYGRSCPSWIRKIELLNREIENYDCNSVISTTEFSDRAITINDSHSTSPWEKGRQLQALCKEEGYELELVNFPPEPVT